MLFIKPALLVIAAHRMQGGSPPPYDPPLMAVCRATRRGAMLTLQGEHAEAGDSVLASRKDLTSPHASHACLAGQACHPPTDPPASIQSTNMLARRFKQIRRHWLTVLLIALSFVVAVPWVDSHRQHPKGVLSPAELEYNRLNPDRPQWKPYPPGMVGYARTFQIGDDFIIRLRTGTGRMTLALEQRTADDEPPAREFYRWYPFAYEHWVSASPSQWGRNGTRAIDGTYRSHLVTVPFWLVIGMCYVYPIVCFVRGPLRRLRRHQRGLCIYCGYDLRGGDGFCPECGETTQAPTDTIARN